MPPQTPSSIEEFATTFASALEKNAHAYGVQFNDEIINRLSAYAAIVQRWNPRLHLVAPCSPAEFATRHILESLLAASHLHAEAHITDVGSGAGLPVIPCLLLRPDITATLIESNLKKTIFLREALTHTGITDRATIINDRFEHTPAPANTAFITCRALDRFTELLPTLLAWSPAHATLILFGGTSLLNNIDDAVYGTTAILIPNSEQRFLFVVSTQDR